MLDPVIEAPERSPEGDRGVDRDALGQGAFLFGNPHPGDDPEALDVDAIAHGRAV
jgi:hypothetical protein